MGLVPYVMPGFGLAKAAAATFAADPNVDGLILDKHGIFTFGDSAKEAYERMIERCRASPRPRLRRGTPKGPKAEPCPKAGAPARSPRWRRCCAAP